MSDLAGRACHNFGNPAHIKRLRSEKLQNVTQLVKYHRSQEKREADTVCCFWGSY